MSRKNLFPVCGEIVTLRWVPFVVSKLVELVHEIRSALSCKTQPVAAGFHENDRLVPEELVRVIGTGIGVKFATSVRAAATVKLKFVAVLTSAPASVQFTKL